MNYFRALKQFSIANEANDLNADRMAQQHTVQNDHTMLITNVTMHRLPIFQNEQYAREAIETLYRVQQLYGFFLYGFVIMHDHCHFLLKVPAPGTISRIMNIYKSGLTFNTGIPKIWQKSFHIRLTDDVSAALEYVHANPVKAGLCKTPEEYPWSSACGRWDISSLPID